MPIESGKHKFQVVNVDNKISVILSNPKDLNNEKEKEFTAKFLLKTIDRLPDQMFQGVDLKVSKEVQTAINEIRRMKSDIEKEEKQYKHRTIADFVEDAKKETLEKPGIFWRSVVIIVDLLPITLVCLMLVLSNNWFSAVIFQIAAKYPNTATASPLVDGVHTIVNDVMSGLGEKILNWVLNSLSALLSLGLAICVMTAMLFVIYSTLYKRMTIQHHRAVIKNSNELRGDELAWYVVLSIVLEEHKIVESERHMITILYELPFDSNNGVSILERFTTLIEIAGDLRLCCPIAMHIVENNVRRCVHMEMHIDEARIKWDSNQHPPLMKLNGRIAMVTLGGLIVE